MSDTDSDAPPPPPLKVCEERIANFVAVTGTDEALAQMRLQNNDWDLQLAIDEHFAVGGATAAAGGETKKKAAPKPVASVAETPQSGMVMATVAPEQVTVVTWNVDGLSEKNLEVRTKAVCALIDQYNVNIVLLQEVVGSTLTAIQKLLPNYQCVSEPNDNYFTAVLLRRFTVYLDSFQTDVFPSTRMGRNLMTVQLHIGKAKLCVMNTHLESTKEHAEERVKQIKFCFQKALEQSEDKTVIFGGDLNIRDQELQSIGGVPTGLDDLWIRTGERKECQYTWDMTRNTNLEFPGRFKPKCRFDRLYIRDSHPRQFVPEHFGLFGIERVPNTQSFPSDHWGLIVAFKVNSN